MKRITKWLFGLGIPVMFLGAAIGDFVDPVLGGILFVAGTILVVAAVYSSETQHFSLP